MHLLARILLVASTGTCACAAVSGLDTYVSSSGEGDAGNAGHPGESAGGESGMEDDSPSADTGGASSDGAVTEDGGENGGACSTACSGGSACESSVCLEGGSDGSAGSRDAGQDTGCTNIVVPPSVNVDATKWTFVNSPTWSCTTGATTTITANTGGASIGGDTCGGSAVLGDISNDYAQTTGGPNALVIRLKALTVAGSHVIQLAGNEPVIFLVAGNVTIDSGGRIDASANGATLGPGGNGSVCGASTGVNSTVTSAGGGGGGFGTAGGYGADQNGNSGSAGGGVHNITPF